MSSSAAAKIQPARTVRMLIFTKDQKALYASIQYLKMHGYSVATLEHIRDPIGALQICNPDVVMISWGFGADEVRALLPQIKEKHKHGLCLIFTEGKTPRETAALLRSGIPTTIYPPLTGRGIHSRVEKFLKQMRGDSKAKKELIEKDKLDTDTQKKLGKVKVIDPDKVPADTIWRKVDRKKLNADLLREDTEVWEGYSPSQSKAKGMPYTFYVETDTPPKFDLNHQKWEALDEQGPVLAAEEDSTQIEMGTVQMALDLTENHEEAIRIKGDNAKPSDFELEHTQIDGNITSRSHHESESVTQQLVRIAEQEKAKVQSPSSHAEGLAENKPFRLEDYANHADFSDYRSGKVNESSLVEKAVRSSAYQLFKGDSEVSQKVKVLQTVGILPFRSKAHNGFLVFAKADNEYDPFMIQSFAKEFLNLMSLSGEKVDPAEILKVELEPITFNDWSDRLEFSAVFSHQGFDVVVGFVPTPNVPVQNKSEEKLLNISPQDNLFVDERTQFDLYLHMPRNLKYILYFKDGTKVTTSILEKFKKHNVSELAIPKAQADKFVAYLINNVLKQKPGA